MTKRTKIMDIGIGGKYKEIIDLKNALEKKISEKFNPLGIYTILEYGASNCLILTFAAISVEVYSSKARKPKILLDVPNYFSTIHYLEAWGYDMVKVKRGVNYEFPLNDYIKRIKLGNPDVILITDPNNPVGTALKKDELYKIMSAVNNNQIIVLDRTSVNLNGTPSDYEIFSKFPNKQLIIINSLSKTHGLEYERIGYLLTNSKPLFDVMDGKRSPFHHLGSLKKLNRLLNRKDVNIEVVSKQRDLIKASHVLLQKELGNNSNVTYLPSVSNFCVIRCSSSDTATQIQDLCGKNNIFIMPGPSVGLTDTDFRMHTTNPKFTKKFISLIKVNNI